MIPQRIERRTYPYQKYALPIKLRNLGFYNDYLYRNSLSLIQEHPELNWDKEVWSFRFCQLNYTLLRIVIIVSSIHSNIAQICINLGIHGQGGIRTPRWLKHIIFSKYLALPMDNLSYKFYGSNRPRTDIYFRDKKVLYQLRY